MQAAGTNSFRVPWVISVLVGAMDRHIEHHLFPRMPHNRLREVAPEVERICREHGIPYRNDSLLRTWTRAAWHAAKLSLPTPRERAQAAASHGG